MGMDEGLFKTTRDALVFALNFSAQQYDRPAMGKAAAPNIGSGRGLGGLDGAGQAGMIRAELARCGRLYEAVLIAQVAPRGVPCSCGSACCSGTRVNREWQDAMGYLADEAVKVLAGCLTQRRMRMTLIEAALCRKKPGVGRLAEQFDRDRDTVSAHSNKIRAWILGDRHAVPEVVGVEHLAWDAFSRRMLTTGMIV